MKNYLPSFRGILATSLTFVPNKVLAHVEKAADGAVSLHDHGINTISSNAPNAAAILLGLSGNSRDLIICIGITSIALLVIYALSLAWDSKRDTSELTAAQLHRSRVRFWAGGTLTAIFVFILAQATCVVAFLTIALIVLALWHAIHKKVEYTPNLTSPSR